MDVDFDFDLLAVVDLEKVSVREELDVWVRESVTESVGGRESEAVG